MLRILISVILITQSFLVFSNDCNSLNEIAFACLNRELTESELENFGDCSDPKTKIKLIDFIMKDEEFISRLILIMRLEFLQSTTENALFEAIQDFDLIMFTQPDIYIWAEDESKKLYKVYNLTYDYLKNKIRFEDIYVTYFNNWIYDQQNMGIENFVNSTFAYAIGRPPTLKEYDASQKMINKRTASLFYKKGNSKNDYLNILSSNQNFYEKQVKYWYYYFTNIYPDFNEVYEILNNIYIQKRTVDLNSIIEYIITNKITD